MVNLVLELPTRQTPGFLKRSKRALEFSQRISAKGNSDPTLFDEMIEFLLPLVKEPTDPDEARAALWDATEEQYDDMMTALLGGKKKEDPPAQSAPSSESTSPE
jgi:glutamine synthetase adenylyltransferase